MKANIVQATIAIPEKLYISTDGISDFGTALVSANSGKTASELGIQYAKYQANGSWGAAASAMSEAGIYKLTTNSSNYKVDGEVIVSVYSGSETDIQDKLSIEKEYDGGKDLKVENKEVELDGGTKVYVTLEGEFEDGSLGTNKTVTKINKFYVKDENNKYLDTYCVKTDTLKANIVQASTTVQEVTVKWDSNGIGKYNGKEQKPTPEFEIENKTASLKEGSGQDYTISYKKYTKSDYSDLTPTDLGGNAPKDVGYYKAIVKFNADKYKAATGQESKEYEIKAAELAFDLLISKEYDGTSDVNDKSEFSLENVTQKPTDKKPSISGNKLYTGIGEESITLGYNGLGFVDDGNAVSDASNNRYEIKKGAEVATWSDIQGSDSEGIAKNYKITVSNIKGKIDKAQIKVTEWASYKFNNNKWEQDESFTPGKNYTITIDGDTPTRLEPYFEDNGFSGYTLKYCDENDVEITDGKIKEPGVYKVKVILNNNNYVFNNNSNVNSDFIEQSFSINKDRVDEIAEVDVTSPNESILKRENEFNVLKGTDLKFDVKGISENEIVNVSYESDNKSVVDVHHSTGEARAIGIGEANIITKIDYSPNTRAGDSTNKAIIVSKVVVFSIDAEGDTSKNNKEVRVTLELDPEAVELNKGEKKEIKAKLVLNGNGFNNKKIDVPADKVDWTVSNEEIANISNDGKNVIALKPGTTTITATVEKLGNIIGTSDLGIDSGSNALDSIKDAEVSKSATVKVLNTSQGGGTTTPGGTTPDEGEKEEIKVSVSPKEGEVLKGNRVNLKATVEPKDAKIEWKLKSEAGVAKLYIDSEDATEAFLETLKEGKVEIEVTASKEGCESASDTSKITIKDEIKSDDSKKDDKNSKDDKDADDDDSDEYETSNSKNKNKANEVCYCNGHEYSTNGSYSNACNCGHECCEANGNSNVDSSVMETGDNMHPAGIMSFLFASMAGIIGMFKRKKKEDQE